MGTTSTGLYALGYTCTTPFGGYERSIVHRPYTRYSLLATRVPQVRQRVGIQGRSKPTPRLGEHVVGVGPPKARLCAHRGAHDLAGVEPVGCVGIEGEHSSQRARGRHHARMRLDDLPVVPVHRADGAVA